MHHQRQRTALEQNSNGFLYQHSSDTQPVPRAAESGYQIKVYVLFLEMGAIRQKWALKAGRVGFF